MSLINDQWRRERELMDAQDRARRQPLIGALILAIALMISAILLRGGVSC